MNKLVEYYAKYAEHLFISVHVELDRQDFYRVTDRITEYYESLLVFRSIEDCITFILRLNKILRDVVGIEKTKYLNDRIRGRRKQPGDYV